MTRRPILAAMAALWSNALDRLATRGKRYNAAFVAAPMCSAAWGKPGKTDSSLFADGVPGLALLRVQA